MVIVLEGIDGCGKTTFANMLKEDYNCLIIQPKTFLPKKGEQGLTAWYEALRLAAHHIDYHDRAGRLVVVDRWIPSLIAYNSNLGNRLPNITEAVEGIKNVYNRTHYGILFICSAFFWKKRDKNDSIEMRSSSWHDSVQNCLYGIMLEDKNKNFLFGSHSPMYYLYPRVIEKLTEHTNISQYEK